jgi:hypothetical protein
MPAPVKTSAEKAEQQALLKTRQKLLADSSGSEQAAMALGRQLHAEDEAGERSAEALAAGAKLAAGLDLALQGSLVLWRAKIGLPESAADWSAHQTLRAATEQLTSIAPRRPEAMEPGAGSILPAMERELGVFGEAIAVGEATAARRAETCLAGDSHWIMAMVWREIRSDESPAARRQEQPARRALAAWRAMLGATLGALEAPAGEEGSMDRFSDIERRVFAQDAFASSRAALAALAEGARNLGAAFAAAWPLRDWSAEPAEGEPAAADVVSDWLARISGSAGVASVMRWESRREEPGLAQALLPFALEGARRQAQSVDAKFAVFSPAADASGDALGEQMARAALEAVSARDGRVPDEAFDAFTLGLAGRWRGMLAERQQAAEALGLGAHRALFGVDRPRLATQEASSADLFEAFERVERDQPASASWRLLRALTQAKTGSLAHLAQASRGDIGRVPMAERLSAMSWRIAESAGANGVAWGGFFGRMGALSQCGLWTIPSKLSATLDEPIGPKKGAQRWGQWLASASNFLGDTASSSLDLASDHVISSWREAARVSKGPETTAQTLRKIERWMREAAGETAGADRRLSEVALAARSMRDPLRGLGSLSRGPSGNVSDFAEDPFWGLAASAGRALAQWASDRAGEAGAKLSADDARLAGAAIAAVAGVDSSWGRRAPFVHAANWVGQNPSAAAALMKGGATDRLALLVASQTAQTLHERLPQELKARWAEQGLSSAGWRWMSRAPALRASYLAGSVGADADTAKENMRDLAKMANALAEANADPAGGFALLCLAQLRRSPYASPFVALSRLLALPDPVLSPACREDAQRLKGQAFDLLPWAERAVLAATLREEARERRERLAHKASKALRGGDEAAAAKARAALAQIDPPPPPTESEAQKNGRHEMTRALADWAAGLSQERAADAGALASLSLKGLRAIAPEAVAKLTEWTDWISGEAGAREALPRRFGVAALEERSRLWHEEAARQGALAKREILIDEALGEFVEGLRAGHASDPDDAARQIEAGGWPMALSRVGAPSAAVSAASDRLDPSVAEPAPRAAQPAERLAQMADGEASAENLATLRAAGIDAFAGWEAIGLATTEALTIEGKEMSHCVGSYATACAKNQSRIFRVKSPANEKLGTLELQRVGSQWRPVQFLGPRNSQIGSAAATRFSELVAEAYSRAAKKNQEAFREALSRDASSESGGVDGALRRLGERVRSQLAERADRQIAADARQEGPVHGHPHGRAGQAGRGQR